MDPERAPEQWRAHLASNPVIPAMSFQKDGLVLGAGTLLWRSDAVPELAEPRLVVLLAAAHRRIARPLALAHIRKATSCWREGSDALASVHLALSRLDRLESPVADAQRMFWADRLLEEGFQPPAVISALDCRSPRCGLRKYSPDQPRVPAGSGRTSGEWSAGSGSPADSSQPASTAGRNAPAGKHDTRSFRVELPTLINCGVAPGALTPFGQAVELVADGVEVADVVSKWRELGPKGEAAVREAVIARGWRVIGQQVFVRTSLGLRVEDLMVYVPPGTDGNATGFDAFIEVKVNGGRYSPLQQAKDAIIATSGGILITPVRRYEVGEHIVRETGLANVTITYVRE
jgi:hypothetical protein